LEVFKYHFDLKIDFGTSEWALAAFGALEVDKELRPNEIHKELKAEQKFLFVTFRAKELKVLRTSVSSFFDMIELVVKTINEFGEME